MKSLQGQLLIATRELLDPNFLQAVILLVQHNEDGAIGLVLNRPTPALLSAIWKKIGSGKCRAQGPLYRGGPCEGPLMALHTDPKWAENEVLPGLYYSADRDEINQLVKQPPAHLKIFAGYAGWGGGQLEGELHEKSWVVTPADAETLMLPDDRIWEETMRHVMGSVMLKSLRIKHVPKDLRAN